VNPLDVKCNGCLAAPGRPCTGAFRTRVQAHEERKQLARDVDAIMAARNRESDTPGDVHDYASAVLWGLAQQLARGEL
jgi:hypothetical protein